MQPRRLCFLLAWICLSAAPCLAQGDREQTDGWLRERDEQIGLWLQTKELTIHPQPEARPALRYRFIPDAFAMSEGNAAVYYLKAMGFLEQDPARTRLRQFIMESADQARQDGEPDRAPPYVWLSTPPAELPLAEVKEYLRLSSFQPPMLREAARRDRMDLDRDLRGVDDPIAYLLPEIQGMRELAGTQSLRCRVAIAEGRIDDAIEITGQQFAMARHLGQDEFLITDLVGIAIAHIAWNDALHLVQHADTPNLYWALASMPRPLVRQRRSMEVERQLLLLQIKVLNEVDERPRPAGYWKDFVDRLLPQIGMLASELKLPSFEEDPEAARAAMVGLIAAAYPGAKRYLLEELGLPPERVEAYPTAQVVFLAMVRFHEHWSGEYFKWMYLPYWQARRSAAANVEESMKAAADRYGFCASPTVLLLPAFNAASTASARNQQLIALLQTVEAVRIFAAQHDGKLPATLEALPVPAPPDPITGRPLDYQLLSGKAMLTGHALPGLQYRLVLRPAP